MKKVEAIIKPFKLDEVKEALHEIGVQGLLHFVELERLDDRFDLVHWLRSSVCRPSRGGISI